MPRSNLCTEPAPLAPTDWATDQGAGVTVQTASGFPRSTVAQVAASSGFVYSASAAAVPGQAYTGSVYTRRVGGVGGRLYLAFLNSDLSFNFGSPAAANITFTANTVQRWDLTGTAPGGAAYLQVWVEYFVFGGDTLETSCALIEDGSTLGSYEDGDSAGWQWDGTAGHSTSSESAASTVASALTATASASASAPSVAGILTAEVPTGSAAGTAPSAGVAPSAGSAAGSVVAHDATVAPSTNAGTGGATAAGLDAASLVHLTAPTAAGTGSGAALDARIQVVTVIGAAVAIGAAFSVAVVVATDTTRGRMTPAHRSVATMTGGVR